jgi:hypothetical protein
MARKPNSTRSNNKLHVMILAYFLLLEENTHCGDEALTTLCLMGNRSMGTAAPRRMQSSKKAHHHGGSRESGRVVVVGALYIIGLLWLEWASVEDQYYSMTCNDT